MKSGEEDVLCYFLVDVMPPSLVLLPGWAGKFSCPYMVKLGPQIIAFFNVQENMA